MPDIKTVTINDTVYDIKDETARNSISDLKSSLNPYKVDYSITGNIYTDGVLYPGVTNRIASDYIRFDSSCIAEIIGVVVGQSTLICAFYDETKTFISGVSYSAQNKNVIIRNAPAGTKYARFCKSTEDSGYAIANVYPQIENSIRKSYDVLDYNLDFAMDNKYIANSSGAEVTGDGYQATDFIRIVSKRIKLTVNFKASAGLAFYDINKNFISAVKNNGNSVGYEIEIQAPNGSAYIRASNIKGNGFVTSLKPVNIPEIITILETTVTPEQYGAVGDGETDDSAAIQNAISTGRKIVFANKTYCVNSEIIIDKDGTVIDCPGEIKVNNNFAFNVKASGCNIYIHKIIGEDIPLSNTLPYYHYNGGGFKLGLDSGNNDNVAYNEIHVDVLDCLEYAFYSQPASRTGVIYNKFSFDYSCCNITICLANRASDDVGAPWSSENYFNGSRIRGNTGIKFIKDPNNDSDLYNGNHFENFGFEGIGCGIDIENAYGNTFKNIRMSETLHGEYWIKCSDTCVNNIFESPSSKVDSRKIQDLHTVGLSGGNSFPNIYRMLLFDGTDPNSFKNWNIGEARFNSGFFYTDRSSAEYRTQKITKDTWYTTKNYASSDVVYYLDPASDIQLRLSKAYTYNGINHFRVFLANNAHSIKLYVMNDLIKEFTSNDAVGLYDFQYFNASGVGWKSSYVG